MKVLHVSAYFAPAWNAGGPARSVLALCQAQQAAGLDVDVLTTTANGGSELPACREGTVYEGVAVRYFPLTAPRGLYGAASMRGALRDAVAVADVVHVHGLFNATVWMATRAARSGGVPYVLSPRGMLEPAALQHHPTRKRAAWHIFDRAAVNRAAMWHACSPFEAATLRRHARDIPIVEIPNPVAPDAPPAPAHDPAHADWLPRHPFILFLGRLHPIKRLDLLAASFARVVSSAPDAELVIAGPDEGGTRAAIAPLFTPVASRVHWAGPVDGARKRLLLQHARALVLCSDSESFGLSVAEAMASGTAVVVTRTCPWPIVAAESCGYWVEQSSDAIAAALLELLRNPALADVMGARGRAAIARHFAPEVVAARWTEAYDQVRGSWLPSRATA